VASRDTERTLEPTNRGHFARRGESAVEGRDRAATRNINPATSRSQSPQCPILAETSQAESGHMETPEQYVERVAHNARAKRVYREAARRLGASC